MFDCYYEHSLSFIFPRPPPTPSLPDWPLPTSTTLWPWFRVFTSISASKYDLGP